MNRFDVRSREGRTDVSASRQSAQDVADGGVHYPLLEALVAYRFVVIGSLALLMYVGGATQLSGLNDWAYFTWASDLLFGERYDFRRGSMVVVPTDAGPLHLYADHPFIQIGPPALLAAKGLQLGPREGIYVAQAVVQVLGLATLVMIDRAFRGSHAHARLVMLVGGSFVTVVWGSLTHFTHLDDALTITAMAAALLALQRGLWPLVGMSAGLAAASKPWGVAVVALVLALPSVRLRLSAAAAAAAVILLFWAPFVLADAGTLSLGEYHLGAAPSAPLTALGLGGSADEPWLRYAQLSLSLAVAVGLVLRGHWGAALVAAFAIRLTFDPNAYQYYTAGVVAAALVADMTVVRFAVPLLTTSATLAWLAVSASPTQHSAAWIRLVSYAIVLLVVLSCLRRPAADDQRQQPCSWDAA